jgi:hypothetical protein
VRPADVLWAEIFPLEDNDPKADPGLGRG